MKKNNLYFVHGWGFDRFFWDPILSILKKTKEKKFEFYVYDLGFFFRPYYPKLRTTQKERNIFISHSYGYNWILKNIKNFDGIVNFSGSANYFYFKKEKVKKRIDFMIKNMKTRPDQVLENFYEDSGMSNFEIKKKFDKTLLITALETLRKDDLSQIEKEFKAPSISVFCNKDRIINIKNITFPPQKKIVNGDHVFPYKCPVASSEIITDFLKNYEL